jgi:hypothetical protein
VSITYNQVQNKVITIRGAVWKTPVDAAPKRKRTITKKHKPVENEKMLLSLTALVIGVAAFSQQPATTTAATSSKKADELVKFKETNMSLARSNKACLSPSNLVSTISATR